MKMCKRCTMSTVNFPCTHCGFEPKAPTKDYRDNHNVQEQVHNKWN